MTSPDLGNFPPDYRRTIAVAAFAISIAAAPAIYVRALEKRVDKHINEVDALRPEMLKSVQDIQRTLNEINSRTERLLEDCYRRGGCKR